MEMDTEMDLEMDPEMDSEMDPEKDRVDLVEHGELVGTLVNLIFVRLLW